MPVVTRVTSTSSRVVQAGEELPDFDPAAFLVVLDDPAVAAAFREDLRETRWLEITRFPAIVVRPGAGERAILILGHRPFGVLHAAVCEMLGLIAQPAPDPVDPVAYLKRWGSATRWEIATAAELDPTACEQRLAADAGLAGRVLRRYLPHVSDVLLSIAPDEELGAADESLRHERGETGARALSQVVHVQPEGQERPEMEPSP